MRITHLCTSRGALQTLAVKMLLFRLGDIFFSARIKELEDD